VIVKKGQPFLGRITPAMDPPQVARDGPLPTTVSGLTTKSASFQRDQVARRTVQNSRSRGCNGGLGRFRFRTATCWRRARTSTAISVRLWKKTRAAAIRARTNDSTDHRFNMT
jgi:hypothetical protein